MFWQINSLREELIPLALLKNENYMSNLRKCFTLNISMPGTLENEHPHKFLKSILMNKILFHLINFIILR